LAHKGFFFDFLILSYKHFKMRTHWVYSHWLHRYILRQTGAANEVHPNQFFAVSASKVAKIGVLCSSPLLSSSNVLPPTMCIIIVHTQHRFNNIIYAYCNNNNNDDDDDAQKARIAPAAVTPVESTTVDYTGDRARCNEILLEAHRRRVQPCIKRGRGKRRPWWVTGGRGLSRKKNIK